MNNFVHLHCHTEFSMLDGMSNIKKLVDRAKKLNMPALAITDHGNMHGALAFYDACADAGIKPIVGMESYLTKWGRNHTSKDNTIDRKPYHLLLLSKNNTGYKNLMNLATLSSLEGFYYKPRVDHQWLKDYSQGIICTSGCMAAEIPSLIAQGQYNLAEQQLLWYRDVFKDDYYVELQMHEGVSVELTETNKTLIALAQKHGIGLIATNDLHYVNEEDAIPHDHLLCVQTNAKITDKDRMNFGDNSYYLKTVDEMLSLFPQEAIDNTLLVAEKCEIKLKDKKFHLPAFVKPMPFTSDADYLAFLCKGGFEEKYGIPYSSEKDQDVYIQGPLVPASFVGKSVKASALRERLDYELSVIKKMNFDSYFLIVNDIIEFCRKNNVWWNIRGSAAGSMVAYVLGLTYLEPICNGLFFERFLNPARVSMPDIDMDFADDQRGLVVDYTVEKYGVANVAQIATFGTMKARAAIKDIGRVTGVPLDQVERVTSILPKQANQEKPLYVWLDTLPKLKEIYEEPQVKPLVDMAIRLEGTIRSVGTHAAGIVIADKNLMNYVPLARLPGTTHLSDKITCITQFGMEHLEDIGLLKMDYLGLKSLTVMRKACELIEARHSITYRMDTIPINDITSYNAISAGDTVGTFQSEGQGMTNVMKEMKPKRFENIIAAISLYRPGPLAYIPQYIRRLNNKEEVTYSDPSMIPALEETFGIMVYQEQVMRICVDVAGMSLSQADSIRKAIGKKKEKDLIAARKDFVEGTVKNGHSKDLANKIYDDILKFADYAFNKAHAADYAQLAVQTAFLKANYRIEYLTALLNSEYDDHEKIEPIISECRREGIVILPPDINHSYADYAIEGESIRYGLKSIKGVGVDKVNLMLKERENGTFKSIQDFLNRVDSSLINRLFLESLFSAGAFDALGNRKALLGNIAGFLDEKKTRKSKAAGQVQIMDVLGLNDDIHEYYGTAEQVSDAAIEKEFELCGVYFSENPMVKALKPYEKFVTHKAPEIVPEIADQKVVIAGIVKSIREITVKNGKSTGKQMAFVKLQDWEGKVEAVAFPQQWEQHKSKLVEGSPVSVFGSVRMSDRGMSFVIDSVSIMPFEINGLVKPVQEVSNERVYLMFDRSEGDEIRLDRLMRLLPQVGGLPVTIVLRGDGLSAVDVPRKLELNSNVAAKLALLNTIV